MKHVSMQINTNSGQSIRIYKDPRKNDIVVEEAPRDTLKYVEIDRVPFKASVEQALKTAMMRLAPVLTFANSDD